MAVERFFTPDCGGKLRGAKQMADSSESFKIGEFIVGTLRGQPGQAVVLDKNDDNGHLHVLWLNDHRCEEIEPAEVAGWRRGAVPDARWVEIFRLGTEDPFFAGYLPSLQAALAACQAFHRREGDYRVVIFTANDYEDQLVEETIDPASGRGYS
jgi:hypothetical protein